jgi:hypothetical protein
MSTQVMQEIESFVLDPELRITTPPKYRLSQQKLSQLKSQYFPLFTVCSESHKLINYKNLKIFFNPYWQIQV